MTHFITGAATSSVVIEYTGNYKVTVYHYGVDSISDTFFVVDGLYTFDVSASPTGIYLLNVSNNSGHYVEKIIITH